ncbi:MAG TPA: hypothetical protein VF121_03720 [Thermoanaerobaculia bacterium]|nr:hypothetical protein [Thermoanaerobaculia bacterium]
MPQPRQCPPSVRSVALLLCAVLLILPVAAHAAAAKAAAKSSVPLGADSPQALVERLTAAAETQDFAEVAASLAPPDRAMMSMMMVLAATMMTAFSQMGSQMASGMAEAFQDEESMTDEQKAKAAADKKKMEEEGAKITKKLEAVLTKHGITELMENTPDPAPGDDPAKNAEKLFADVDQVALISDIMGLMKESFKDSEKPADSPMGKIPKGELKDLKVTGDTATGTIDGEPVHFVKVDGRWFLKMAEAAPEKTE